MRDGYQGCLHVETGTSDIDDTKNEHSKGMTGCYTDLLRDRKRIVRNPAGMIATKGDS